MYAAYKHEGRVFFDRKRVHRKRSVIRRLGVKKNSFAGNMVSRLYDYYFRGAVVFRKEYRKYYKKEFETMVEFLEQRYDLEHGEAEKYAKGDYAMTNCSRMSIERNIETLNYDEDLKKKFSDAVGGLIDEDPDGFYY